MTVPVSAGLLANPGTYFAALGEYREGNPVAIVERLSDASFGAIANCRQLVTDLRQVREGGVARFPRRQTRRLGRSPTFFSANR